MQNKPQKSQPVNLSDPEILDKFLNSKNPLAKELVTNIVQRDNEDAEVERSIKKEDAKIKRWNGLIQTSVVYIVGGILILFIGVIGFLFGKQGSKDN